MGNILKTKYALELVAFLNIKLNTREGFAYLVMAVDVFAGYVINFVVEKDEGADSILKNESLITVNKNFI